VAIGKEWRFSVNGGLPPVRHLDDLLHSASTLSGARITLKIRSVPAGDEAQRGGERSLFHQPLPMGIFFSALAASARLASVILKTPLSKVAETLSASTISPSWKDLWKLP